MALALADWGKAHRFAGSGDRAAIGNLVYDALRRRQSLAAQMGSDSPRALVLGVAPRAFAMTPDAVAAAADGSEHALEPLSAEELAALQRPPPTDQPAARRRRLSRWLAPSLARTFGDRAAEEGKAPGRARAGRPAGQHAEGDAREGAQGARPLRRHRDAALAARRAHPGAAGAAAPPHVEAEAAHGKGWFEVQDEGSQIAALMAGAGARQQVLDLCAGAGGKTLALSALMQNTGQIYAYDRDRSQLRPIFERLKRAGARNVQVMNGGDEAALEALGAALRRGAGRCAVHRLGHLAAAARFEMAPEAAELADRQEEQRAALDARRAIHQARRPPRLRHLLDPAGGERRPGRLVPGESRRLDVGALARALAGGVRERRRPIRPTAATNRCC